MYNKIKIKVYDAIANEQSTSRVSGIFNGLIFATIFYSLIIVIIRTVPSIEQRYSTFFTINSILITIIFTIEYILRIWSCNAGPQYPGIIRGRLKYAAGRSQVFDLLAILPLYIYFITGFDARILLIFRFFRIFRIFRLAGYSKAMSLLRNAVKNKARELILVFTLIILGLLFCSVAIYFAERYVKPEWFDSVPKSMWWAIITMATVGYGDTYPVTVAGKFIGIIAALMGVLIIALPAGILSSGLSDEVQKLKKPPEKICPHCGKKIGPGDN